MSLALCLLQPQLLRLVAGCSRPLSLSPLCLLHHHSHVHWRDVLCSETVRKQPRLYDVVWRQRYPTVGCALSGCLHSCSIQFGGDWGIEHDGIYDIRVSIWHVMKFSRVKCIKQRNVSYRNMMLVGDEKQGTQCLVVLHDNAQYWNLFFLSCKMSQPRYCEGRN